MPSINLTTLRRSWAIVKLVASVASVAWKTTVFVAVRVNVIHHCGRCGHGVILYRARAGHRGHDREPRHSRKRGHRGVRLRGAVEHLLQEGTLRVRQLLR